MNNYPYILSDLDGTISLKDFSISKKTIKMIKKYQKLSNNRFSFCTGRVDGANKKIAKQLKVSLPIISCNGALISNLKTNEVLHADYLNNKLISELFKLAHEHDIDIVGYTHNMMIGTFHSERVISWQNYMNKTKKKYHWEIKKYNDLLEISNELKNNNLKIVEVIISLQNLSDDKAKEKLDLIKECIKDKFDLVQSLPKLFNIMKKKTNKLSGLKHFAKALNINYKDIIVFGDNHNDIEMVKGVKQGYCVENGVDELKKVAFEVCDSLENNGVAKKIEQIIKEVQNQK
ncbi:Cof-type HAD-IIB family hydrolase [Mycoplasma mycoides]|uniref:Cof-type HAD-IIB family hydrolase n=1 Tax=Mycoplasma mycoides TaxID=2102 RepID=UPI00223FC573|nr:Cof-type HAD-IIB family hydrolase [Mycoplasma mycoides]QVJ95193.1 Cof-type HAD-IIB family hydrolase [Mycoplasma mycoides subsp. capri]